MLSSHRLRRIFLLALCALAAGATVQAKSWAETISVVSFNVESDRDTDPAAIVTVLQSMPASDLWALVEVDEGDFETYRKAIGREYRLLRGKTGGNEDHLDDRLAIVYNPARLRLIGDVYELAQAGGSRHPLVARFAVRDTGKEIVFVANHLQRGNKRLRRQQAEWLNAWAKETAASEPSVGIIMAGDYNFDVDQKTLRGNRAFALFQKGSHITWLKPVCLETGNCPPTGTGCNPRYNSILDFIFVAGAAQSWKGESDLLFLEDSNYCRNEGTSRNPGGSDHRPVRAEISFE